MKEMRDLLSLTGILRLILSKLKSFCTGYPFTWQHWLSENSCAVIKELWSVANRDRTKQFSMSTGRTLQASSKRDVNISITLETIVTCRSL